MLNAFIVLCVFLFGTLGALGFSEKQISFKSQGITLKGTLFLPTGFSTKQKIPGVIVTGAWTTVKEQMPRTYAIEMANRGYAALTFDFTGWGESEGKNRYMEDPVGKTQDIIAAVEYLHSRKEIDNRKIAGIGICASSGYMADAYTMTKKLKSVTLVAPWLHSPEIAKSVYGGEDSVNKLLSAADEARDQFKRTGRLTTAVAASTKDKNSIMFKAPYYTEKDRGLIKEYDNKFNIGSWRPWLTYDAMASAKKLPGPILFVGSDAMALPKGAETYASLAKGKVTKVWLDNITQFDFYDQKNAVSRAVDSAHMHFTKYL
ncbi:MAG: alpha/beta hydrolase [Pseudobacteriovorax sp.]|nr:alpha/beta hydrolase [Pseudobacteriovorax sp.]